MPDNPTIAEIPAPWRNVAMICGKCSRKLNGGFGKKGKHGLGDMLKAALKHAGRRRELRVVEVGCLGLCPKRAVTLVTTAQPDRALAVPEGMEIAQVLARLSPVAAAMP